MFCIPFNWLVLCYLSDILLQKWSYKALQTEIISSQQQATEVKKNLRVSPSMSSKLQRFFLILRRGGLELWTKNDASLSNITIREIFLHSYKLVACTMYYYIGRRKYNQFFGIMWLQLAHYTGQISARGNRNNIAIKCGHSST